MEFLSVTNTLANYLRIQIIMGGFVPGQKLNEAELASRFKISRPPLREAYRILENDQLIVSVPRKGCYVTELSVESSRDIFEAREALEYAALDLIQQRGRTDLSTLASVLKETSKLHKPADNDPFKKYDYLRAIAEFHFKLIEASGNVRILQFYNSIFFSLARYQNLYVFIPGLMDESQQVHEQILDTLLKGNYDLGKELLKTHIRLFSKYLEEILEKKGGNFSSGSTEG